jgi:hypothetical protein
MGYCLYVFLWPVLVLLLVRGAVRDSWCFRWSECCISVGVYNISNIKSLRGFHSHKSIGRIPILLYFSFILMEFG